MNILGKARLRIVEPGFIVEGRSVLRERARDLTREEILSSAFRSLVDLMVETMRDGGVGLAAPQVGIPLRLAVVEDRQPSIEKWPPVWIEKFERRPFAWHVLINPVLTITSDTLVEAHEACLSVPGMFGIVPRAYSCRIDGLDMNAEPVTLEARGWRARIYQHECDHLDGHVCVGKFKPGTFITQAEFVELRERARDEVA